MVIKVHTQRLKNDFQNHNSSMTIISAYPFVQNVLHPNKCLLFNEALSLNLVSQFRPFYSQFKSFLDRLSLFGKHIKDNT